MTDRDPDEYAPCPRHGTRCYPEIKDLGQRIETAIGLGSDGIRACDPGAVPGIAARILMMVEDRDRADLDHLAFILGLLALLRDADMMGQDTPLIWSVQDGRARLSMMCSDTFAWGCADAEEVTAADMPLLRQCLTDLRAAEEHGEIWLGELYCCRKRGMRPMNRWVKDMREREGLSDVVRALIEAAGPVRESVFGAP